MAVPQEWQGDFLAEFRRHLLPSIVLEHEPGPDTEVWIQGRPFPEALDGLPKLRAVVVPFAGIPASTLETMRRFPRIQLFNLHHNASATAEMAIALMMAVGRNLIALDAGLRLGEWADRTIPDSVGTRTLALSFEGAHVVIVGYGEIGRRIGKTCVALGASVEAIRRTEDARTEDGITTSPISRLSESLGRADVLHIAAPLTDQTEGLIGPAELSCMKPESILVNVARGPIVDESALFEALRTHQIAGAGLDVWWRYPTVDEPKTAPSRFDFASLDNVVMTPHLGGSNRQTERRRVEALAETLNGLAAGNPTRPVDLALGY